MNTDQHGFEDPLTHSILGACSGVSNVLGAGFLEKSYENSVAIELRSRGRVVQQQVPTPIFCKGECVGEYIADMIVDGAVIMEIKAVRALDDVHVAQCMNYLRATKLKVCLRINFGNPQVKWQRIVG